MKACFLVWRILSIIQELLTASNRTWRTWLRCHAAQKHSIASRAPAPSNWQTWDLRPLEFSIAVWVYFIHMGTGSFSLLLRLIWFYWSLFALLLYHLSPRAGRLLPMLMKWFYTRIQKSTWGLPLQGKHNWSIRYGGYSTSLAVAYTTPLGSFGNGGLCCGAYDAVIPWYRVRVKRFFYYRLLFVLAQPDFNLPLYLTFQLLTLN